MPSFDYEKQHLDPVAGVDEVGYGAWAGPVFTCACVLDPLKLSDFLLNKLNDSKKLSLKKRELLFEELIASPGVQYTLGFSTPQEIDGMNVLKATHLAMQRALDGLEGLKTVLVDGKNKPLLNIPVFTIIDGDEKSYSIAAASIIAKVTRDRVMKELHEQYPHYGWDKNVGYGTRLHQEGLKMFGVTSEHRKTYKPIQKYL